MEIQSKYNGDMVEIRWRYDRDLKRVLGDR